MNTKLRQRLKPLRRWTSPVNALLTPRATARPPIILVGMHRSGTTMLVHLLERCGVFMGQPQTSNKEAAFFQQLNRRTLDTLGCCWRCLDYLPETEQLVAHYDWLADWLARKLERGLITKFWGRQAWRLLWPAARPYWGWKDPRNSLLLPLWGRFFPDATVIHIVRDGRDVALSLLTREIEWLGQNIFERQAMERRLLADVRLWEAYYHRAEAGMQLFERRYTLRFEDLLADPPGEMAKLLDITGLDVTQPLERVVSIVDSSRTARYASDEFAWVKTLPFETPLLREAGYDTP